MANPEAEFLWIGRSGKGLMPTGADAATITGVLKWLMVVVAHVTTWVRPRIKDQAVVTSAAISGLTVALAAEARWAGLPALILKVSVSGMMAMIVMCPVFETIWPAVDILAPATRANASIWTGLNLFCIVCVFELGSGSGIGTFHFCVLLKLFPQYVCTIELTFLR
jgi:hypothetical protein